MASNKAIFLDRDGTINKMVYYPEEGLLDCPFVPSQFELLPRVGAALRMLRKKGYLLIVVSNQGGLAKGTILKRDFEAIDRKMDVLLKKEGVVIDSKHYAFYHKDGVVKAYAKDARLRKPNPGMILDAAKKYSINLKQSYMIGDGVVDMRAGGAAGCTTIFLGSLKPGLFKYLNGVIPDIVCVDLFAAAKEVK
jgi:D-glycero-D-manno-heptose 1,7-bisphosphate phosphatase